MAALALVQSPTEPETIVRYEDDRFKVLDEWREGRFWRRTFLVRHGSNADGSPRWDHLMGSMANAHELERFILRLTCALLPEEVGHEVVA